MWQEGVVDYSLQRCGIAIRVSEEVSTSSKAGKEFLKRKEEEGLDVLIEKKPSIPAKRTSGLTSILSKLSKKPKMSTLVSDSVLPHANL